MKRDVVHQAHQRHGTLAAFAGWLLAAGAGCQFDASVFAGRPGGDGVVGLDGGAAEHIDGGTTVGATGDAGPRSGWLDEGWEFRKKIVIRGDRVAADRGPHLNFPLLVVMEDRELVSALPDGADLVFTASDGYTRLAHEVESWWRSRGCLVAWVRIPELSAGADTTIYLYFGNLLANPREMLVGKEAAWDQAFRGVWHLAMEPQPFDDHDVVDSTLNRLNGSASQFVEATTGQIGRGLAFDGYDDYIDYPGFEFGDSFTISLWVHPTGRSTLSTLVSNASGGGMTNGFRWFINSYGTSDRAVLFETGTGRETSAAITRRGVVRYDQWNHLAVVVDRRRGSAAIFRDGEDVTVRTGIATRFSTRGDWEIGRMETSGWHLRGLIDEVRVEAGTRTAAWIRTNFRNQSDPGDFLHIGLAELHSEQ
jgi:hypothetical protein